MPPDFEERTDRLYLFCPSLVRDLYCGKTNSGRQFLLGPKDASTACVVFFDGEGNYLGWKEHFIGAGALFSLLPSDTTMSPEQWESVVRGHYERLIADLGGRLEPIQVHAFVVPDADFDMSISDLPYYLDQLLKNSEEEKRLLGRVEYERLMGLLADWIERGDYVLDWGGTFHVDKGGEIVFS